MRSLQSELEGISLRGMPLKTLLFAVFLALAPSVAAAGVHNVTVVTEKATLMVNEGKGMLPVMTVPRGTTLVVSDTAGNGWRQVLIRQPGVKPRWGWVKETDIVAGVAKNTAPAAGPRESVSESSHDHFYAGLIGGYSMVTSGGHVPSYGVEAGVRLSGQPSDAFFLVAHFSLQGSAFTLSDGTTSALAKIRSVEGGLAWRAIGDSHFYLGVLGGLAQLSLTYPTSASSSQKVSLSGYAGYDFRLSKRIFLGPELYAASIDFGAVILVQPELAFRFYF